MLELPLDFGSGEVAAEGGVVNVVVGGELAERLAGGPASNKRRVGNEPTRSRPRHERDGGLWQLKRVIGEGADEDRRVDQIDGLFQGAQLVGVEHGLGTPTGGDDTLSDLVERVVLVGTGGRNQPLLAAGIGALLLYYSLGIAYNNDGRLRVAIALSSSALAGVIGALTAESSRLVKQPFPSTWVNAGAAPALVAGMALFHGLRRISRRSATS